MENYDTILYIDADCLVVKDVSHLLDVDSDQASSEKECTKRAGLLAAAPDIFPPDKFNAGVMVIRPSKSIFEDMMSCLSGNNATASKNIEQSKTYKSYDGGDTGFLNSYYPHWFRDMPSYSRLSFGYNAQRFMHHCTFDKQPNYWNEGIEDLRIVHYSSSPKPWEKSSGNPKSEENDKRNHNDSFLDEKDADSIQRLTKRGKLENMWQAAYERSQKYYMKEMQKRLSQTSAAPPPSSASVASHSSKQTKPPQDVHRLVQKRFKELRKTGKSTKEAMQAARAEYGMDQAEEGLDPSRSVGQMFGLM